MNIVTIETFLSRDIPAPTPLIEGLLHEGERTLLFAGPKMKKTFLATQIALCVAGGTPLGPFAVPAPRRVLYFQFDTGLPSWRKRLATQLVVAPTARENLYVPDAPILKHHYDLFTPHDYDALHHAIASVDPALVVFDMLANLHYKDESNSLDAEQIWDRIRLVCGERAILVIHHSRKPSHDTPGPSIYDARGSSVLTGKPENLWQLTQDTWEVVGRDIEPMSLPIDFDPLTLTFTIYPPIPDTSAEEDAALVERLDHYLAFQNLQDIPMRVIEAGPQHLKALGWSRVEFRRVYRLWQIRHSNPSPQQTTTHHN